MTGDKYLEILWLSLLYFSEIPPPKKLSKETAFNCAESLQNQKRNLTNESNSGHATD
jgi:hypothetical protein